MNHKDEIKRINRVIPKLPGIVKILTPDHFHRTVQHFLKIQFSYIFCRNATLSLGFILFSAVSIAQTIPVTFHYKPSGSVGSVYIGGDFNNFNDNDPNGKLSDSDGDGIYETTVELNKGTHVYKFVVDGNWVADPDNPVTDGSQYQNSQITVSDPMITYLLPLTGSFEYNILSPPAINAIIAFGNGVTVNVNNLSLKLNSKSISLSTGNYNQSGKTLTYTPNSGDMVEGTNAVEFTVTTPKGKSVKSISILVSSLPRFELLTENMVYFIPSIKVYGKLSDFPVHSVQVKFNGIIFNGTINADSIFYAPVTLTEGENDVEVSVTNGYGTRKKTQKMIYDSNLRPSVDVQAFVNGRCKWEL